MSAFIINLLRGRRPVIYGTGEKRRDFVHVDDVNAFHILAMTDPRTDGRVFNLGTGVSYSINEIYEIIRKQLRLKQMPEYKPGLPAEAEVTLADISAARSLGWRPRIGVEEGIAGMIEWIRRNVVKV